MHNVQSYLPDLTQAPGRSGIWCRAHLKDLVHALHVEFPHPMWRQAEGAAVDAQADLLRQLPPIGSNLFTKQPISRDPKSLSHREQLFVFCGVRT
jgi:hypothetical protein